TGAKDEPAQGDKKVHDIITSKGEVNAAHSTNKGKAHHHGIKNKNLAAVVNALEKPVCWAPLLALILVIIGVKFPTFLDPCFELIAKANSGVAVLAAGLALSTVRFSLGVETIWNTFFRLILTPAVFILFGIMLGMAKDGNTLSMLVMAVGLPPAFSGIIISSRYNIYVREGASTVAVSTVGFALTCILIVWLMPIITKAFGG
ncbi:MAG: AEC family transporter, partial [Eggerthellaceae bacterium]|nr:AEC family transporter [Eggerthellaceae bacterium]